MFWVNLALFAATFLFICFLCSRAAHRNYRWLYVFIGMVWLLGTIIHCAVYSRIPEHMDPPSSNGVDAYSTFWISAISSVEMFLGRTRIFDNGFQEVLFSKDGTLLLIGLSFLYTIAVSISIFVIFNVLFQRIISRWRLKMFANPGINEEVHIFFGMSRYAQLLIRGIDTATRKIYCIDYPEKDEDNFDISFTSGLSRLSRIVERNGDIIHLKAKHKMSDVEFSDKSIAEILDIKGIDDVIFRHNSFVYFLSDNEQENITNLNNLYLRKRQICSVPDSSMKVCHVICHAKKEGYNIGREDRYKRDFDIIFVDSSYLAIQQIIREDPGSLPVNFVDIATQRWTPANDSDKQELSGEYSLGYVNSDFKAAIFGFGELGHDAFDFLFEYGAFVDKDKKRSKFVVDIFDKAIESNEKSLFEFKKDYPGMNNAESIIKFSSADFESDEFWSQYKGKDYNYIFICAGNDDLNERILGRLDKSYTFKQDSKKLRVMVKHSLGDTKDYAESIEKIGECTHFFGSDDAIWKWDIISNQSLEADAKKYFVNYTLASNDAKDELEAEEKWRMRENEISDLQNKDRKKRIRQRSQDFANCLHLNTKIILMGDLSLKNAKALSTSITSRYIQPQKCKVADEPHCSNCPEPTGIFKQLLYNMAITEHLRWEASHIIMGYTYGKTTDDNAKQHDCLTEYEKVPDSEEQQFGETRHYDWIVIKTTLDLASSENK